MRRTDYTGTKIVDLVETPGMVGTIIQQGKGVRCHLIKVEWSDGTLSIEDLADEGDLWVMQADYAPPMSKVCNDI